MTIKGNFKFLRFGILSKAAVSNERLVQMYFDISIYIARPAIALLALLLLLL